MPETRTVKGFSEVLLPFAEEDFESAPLWPLRYLSVCWFGKPTLKLYHIIFGFASVLQNFIIRYLNVFVRTHFYSAMVLAIEHFLWRYPLRMQGKIIPIGLSSRNPSRTSFRMTRPANPVCSSCRSQRPGKCRCRHTPSRESEYTLSPTALSVFYREIAIRISAYFEDHRNFYRVDFVGERMCLLYLRTVNAASDFYAFCVSCTIGTGTAERVLVQPCISRLLYPPIYGILLPAQKLIFPSA